MIDIEAYLARLGINNIPRADEDGLAQLIEAHILNVPFENFDIPLGLGIHLETDHLFEKIVTRRRGGYCFELNGLFGSLLDGLGFERHPVMARVWFRGPPATPPLTHTLNIVTIGNTKFMADVGFGGTTARLPVPLYDQAVVEDVDGTVSLRKDDEFGFMLIRETPNGPEEQFSTTGAPAYDSDLLLGNHYVSTHPASHFTQMAVGGIFTNDGRVGVTDSMLTTRTGWDQKSSPIETAEDYHSVLTTHFGIDLGEDHRRIFEAFKSVDVEK